MSMTRMPPIPIRGATRAVSRFSAASRGGTVSVPWLNAGVPASQVAEWAGHSIAMLLNTYAKCIEGQQE